MRPSAEVVILDDDEVNEPPVKRRRSIVTPSASADVVPRGRLRTRRPAAGQLEWAVTYARRKVKARREREELPDNAECSEATSQPPLASDQLTSPGVWVAGVENTESLEERPSGKVPSEILRERPLEKGEEEDEETDTETSGRTSSKKVDTVAVVELPSG